MGDFEKALQLIIPNEGGKVNNPADRGGKTNYGISQAFLDSIGDRRDPYDLTWEDAKELYKKYFWDKTGGDELPDSLAVQVFDAAVNHGPKRAASFLQDMLNDYGADLEVDGVIGSQTLDTAITAWQKFGVVLLGDYIHRRRVFYDEIVTRIPSQKVFHRGWYNRLIGCAKFAWNQLKPLMIKPEPKPQEPYDPWQALKNWMGKGKT